VKIAICLLVSHLAHYFENAGMYNSVMWTLQNLHRLHAPGLPEMYASVAHILRKCSRLVTSMMVLGIVPESGEERFRCPDGAVRQLYSRRIRQDVVYHFVSLFLALVHRVNVVTMALRAQDIHLLSATPVCDPVEKIHL